MKKSLILLLLLPLTVMAQNSTSTDSLKYDLASARAFQHLEAGVTLGTTGIGFDVAMPLHRSVKLRAGFSYMPKMGNVGSYSMSSVGGDASGKDMKRLAELLNDMMYKEPGQIDDRVDMKRYISYWNAKLLLDWYPFKKKNWHFTAGFYVGSDRIGRVYNTQEESPTTMAILMYNDMYDQIQGLGPYEYPVMHVGNVSFELDPFTGQQVIDRFNHYGRVAVQFGTYPDGTPFYMEPGRNSIMEAKAHTNVVKPYVGFGYNLGLGKEQRWSFGFDAGLMVWGTPHIYCDGYKFHADAEEYSDKIEHVKKVCLIHDVKNIGGIVGSSVNLVKHMPFLPVLEVKVAYNIF